MWLYLVYHKVIYAHRTALDTADPINEKRDFMVKTLTPRRVVRFHTFFFCLKKNDFPRGAWSSILDVVAHNKNNIKNKLVKIDHIKNLVNGLYTQY